MKNYIKLLILGYPPQRLYVISSRLLISCFIFVCCYWLLGIILTSSIQTNLIVLDLSDISNNLQHIIKTKRLPCFMKGEKYLNKFRKAAAGSIFHQVWNINSNKRCIFDKEMPVHFQTQKPSYLKKVSMISEEMYM